jgi:hypothetical protein
MPQAETAKQAKPLGEKHRLPADGRELMQRLRDYDSKLAGQGVCAKGDLVAYITEEGVKAGYPANLAAWSGPAFEFAATKTRAFEEMHRRPAGEPKAAA